MALISVQLITKSGAFSLYQTKGSVWFEAAPDWCASWEWNRGLLVMALTSDAVVSMPAFEPHEYIVIVASSRHLLLTILWQHIWGGGIFNDCFITCLHV